MIKYIETFAPSVRSYRTTLLGIIAALLLLLPQIQAALDDDEATVPDWDQVKIALAMLGIGVVAKDGHKKSEDVGL